MVGDHRVQYHDPRAQVWHISVNVSLQLQQCQIPQLLTHKVLVIAKLPLLFIHVCKKGPESIDEVVEDADAPSFALAFGKPVSRCELYDLHGVTCVLIVGAFTIL